MAVEPWNKINIPYPGVAAACRIPFNTRTAAVTEAVVVHCGNVLKLLGSRVLNTEIRVVHEILYVLHNGFRQHKPFLAIKQVQQCINRLQDMKLQAVLQDLQELCPNQIQRDVGVDVGHCDVPSHPMLEWFCLKVLGASSLLCRTLDQCTKAFSLTRQHLRLSEFIVLNLVLTCMLSRLWVFFRGILRTLVPVYEGIMALLHEVVHCQPMTFLPDFTLPGDLAVFLGSTYSDLLEERSTPEPFGMKNLSVLDRLFEEGSEEQVEKREEEEMKIMQMLAREEMTSSMDLGRTILRRGPPCSRSSADLDIKSMLQQTSKQCAVEVFSKTASPGQPSTSSLPVLEQKKMFLKRLSTASSIKDMAAHFEQMMGWCKRSKLYWERRYLAFMLLRCQRMKALECEGISVQKKLRRLRLRVHNVMLKGTDLVRPSLFLQRRTNCYFRTRFTTLLRCYGSVRSRVGKVRMRSRVARDLFNVTAKSSHKCRKYTKVSPIHNDVMSGSEGVFSQKKSKMETSSLKSSSVHNDEIDNIFASFGF
ncbi:nucleolus and neural progenitor protein isoform X1 [Ictalurus punctatus]|uniref:Nucleolus and neural progenitor protein isoform X1 n=2 Tax=Ictalurus punctatus TaxID=7998 RepID=A0A2D0R6W6_ICTPU|nr:nucleolus and neural progenitor protein isoform X1 [Ictalurus punctatus]